MRIVVIYMSEICVVVITIHVRMVESVILKVGRVFAPVHVDSLVLTATQTLLVTQAELHVDVIDELFLLDALLFEALWYLLRDRLVFTSNFGSKYYPSKC